MKIIETLEDLKKQGYISVILNVNEIKEIIKALEKINKKESELGNDLKMVLKGTL
jgi:hypothetical protein